MSSYPIKGDAFTCQDFERKVDHLNLCSTSLPNFDQWAPSLQTAARAINCLPVPTALLIGQQALLYPNTVMNTLLSGVVGYQGIGRSILEIFPQCAQALEKVYSNGACRADQPVLFSSIAEGKLRWSQLEFTPVVNGHDAVEGILGVATDVTHHIERIHELSETEQRFCMALESSGMVGIWDFDVKADISTSDANVARTFGLSPDECRQGLKADFYTRAVHRQDRLRVVQTLKSAIRNKASYRCKYRVTNDAGPPRWVIASGKPCYDEAGELIRLLGVIVDVTDQMETTLALEKSRFEFETLTETLPQIVWSCDDQGQHDYFSRRWSEFTGVQPEQITENTWKELVHPDHWEMVSSVWAEARNKGMPYDVNYRFLHHSGVYRWLRVMALPIRNSEGHITRWFGTSTDVHESYLISSERERLAKELERIATEDQLTEALTRRAFIERATTAIKEATEQETPVGLIMLDIDHFKSINDTYGHPGGDKVLSIVSKRIKSSLTQEDLFGRLGGEEFSVLLRDCNSEQAQGIAERIRQAISRDPVALEGGLQIAVTISVGVTARIPKVADLDRFILIADQALYTAKTSGRNQSVFHNDSMETQYK